MSVHPGDTSVQALLAGRVAGLSGAAPFAVPTEVPGQRRVYLVSGGPAPEALPLADLAATFDSVLRRTSRAVAALQYSDSAGLPRLRALLAGVEGVSPDRLIVTNGALHGVWLALHALVEPGDLVAVDDPIFPDTARIIESAGGSPVGIPVDRDGLDIDVLEARLRDGLRIKAVYTVPDFHNPSGFTLSAARRRRLLDLAAHDGFVVVSDNPYRQHRLSGVQVPDFSNDSAHVVRVSTFSKTLGPGLRLGWLVAPAWLAPHLVNLRRRVDFHSGTLTQQVVADLLERPGWFDQLATRARDVYAHRAKALVTSLRTHAPDLLRFVDPDGGFFVWAEVSDEQLTAATLAQACADAGLVFARGAVFAVSPDSSAHRYVRLAYSAADVDDLGQAGPQLAAVADRLRARASTGSAR